MDLELLLQYLSEVDKWADVVETLAMWDNPVDSSSIDWQPPYANIVGLAILIKRELGISEANDREQRRDDVALFTINK